MSAHSSFPFAGTFGHLVLSWCWLSCSRHYSDGGGQEQSFAGQTSFGMGQHQTRRTCPFLGWKWARHRLMQSLYQEMAVCFQNLANANFGGVFRVFSGRKHSQGGPATACASFDTTHSLAVDPATDYVVCSICHGNEHPKEWKSFARTQCPGKPSMTTESSGGPKRKAELREQFMKKRGRSAPSAAE